MQWHTLSIVTVVVGSDMSSPLLMVVIDGPMVMTHDHFLKTKLTPKQAVASSISALLMYASAA